MSRSNNKEIKYRVYADSADEIDAPSRWVWVYEADSLLEVKRYIEDIAPYEGFTGVPLKYEKVYIGVDT